MGLNIQDMKGDKPVGMRSGAFCLKGELEHIRGELDKVPDMRRDSIKDCGQAYGAFFYGMGNREHHIDWQGDRDVPSCLGPYDDVCEDGKDVDEYMDAMGLSPVTEAAYRDARGDSIRIADEKGRYRQSFLQFPLPSASYRYILCYSKSGKGEGKRQWATSGKHTAGVTGWAHTPSAVTA